MQIRLKLSLIFSIKLSNYNLDFSLANLVEAIPISGNTEIHS